MSAKFTKITLMFILLCAVFTILLPPVQASTNVMVTFKDDNGQVIATETVTQGETVARPQTDPDRPGWTFAGWFGDSGFSTPFDFSVPITADTEIYARFVHVVAYTLSYGTAGGAPVSAQTLMPNEIPFKPVNDPVKAGQKPSRVGIQILVIPYLLILEFHLLRMQLLTPIFSLLLIK